VTTFYFGLNVNQNGPQLLLFNSYSRETSTLWLEITGNFAFTKRIPMRIHTLLLIFSLSSVISIGVQRTAITCPLPRARTSKTQRSR